MITIKQYSAAPNGHWEKLPRLVFWLNEFFQQLCSHQAIQLCRIYKGSLASGDYDKIIALVCFFTKLRLDKAKRLPYDPSCTAALYCVADFLSGNYTEAVHSAAAFTKITDESTGNYTCPFFEQILKFSIFPDAYILFRVFSHGLVAQLCSALCASSLQNLSAVSGCHSLSEAVLHLSLTLLGLISSFHVSNSFLYLRSFKPEAQCFRHVSLIIIA